MPRTCTICSHERRAEIDQALVAPIDLHEIESKYNVSIPALRRHKAAHVPLTLAKAEETRQVQQAKDMVAHALDVVQQLQAINTATLAILKAAQHDHDHDLALRAIDRVQKQIELQAKLLGDLQPDGSVNITISTEWVQIRAVLMQALAPYPDAATAVAQALLEVDRDRP